MNAVDSWLRADPGNVAVIHCLVSIYSHQGGKGRTGTVITCYLYYSGAFDTAEAAEAYYASKRSAISKGSAC
jgi:protein-tyrosine phosphatase